MVGAHRDFFGTLDFLRNLPLFRDLDLNQLEALAEATRELRLPAGMVVFRRGDPCDGMHVVALGRVKLSLLASAGAEKVVEILGPGQSFGVAVMLIGRPQNLYAETIADSLVLHIRTAAIAEIVQRNPDFARDMLMDLARRQCRLVADIEAYTMKSATERVTGFLLSSMAEHHSGAARTADVLLTASKSVLASRLNITREHFSRILHELSEAGLIHVSGRNIQILDPDGLHARRN